MPKHEANDQDMGYFLSEDGQARLAKLKEHMEFLSRLALPRTADEEREWAPEVGVGEVAVCLELLAEQVDSVLAEMSWFASRPAEAGAAERDDACDDEDDDAHDDADDAEPEAAPKVFNVAGKRLVYGLTVAQSDELDRLVQAISAHGDVLAMADPDDLAEGTVPTLGQAIHDAATEVREILEQLSAQRLAPLPRPLTGVREERAVYAAGIAAVDGPSGSVLPLPACRPLGEATKARTQRLH